VLLPAWVAIGAIAALAADLTIEIERTDKKPVELPGPALAGSGAPDAR
jgi:hypothetical protein